MIAFDFLNAVFNELHANITHKNRFIMQEIEKIKITKIFDFNEYLRLLGTNAENLPKVLQNIYNRDRILRYDYAIHHSAYYSFYNDADINENLRKVYDKIYPSPPNTRKQLQPVVTYTALYFINLITDSDTNTSHYVTLTHTSPSDFVNRVALLSYGEKVLLESSYDALDHSVIEIDKKYLVIDSNNVKLEAILYAISDPFDPYRYRHFIKLY